MRSNESKISHRWRKRAEFALEVLKPFESYASQRPAVGCIAWLDDVSSFFGFALAQPFVFVSPHFPFVMIVYRELIVSPQFLGSCGIASAGSVFTGLDFFRRQPQAFISHDHMIFSVATRHQQS
jgi:hypothetical protein